MTITPEDLDALEAKAERYSERGMVVDVMPGVLLELIRLARMAPSDGT